MPYPDAPEQEITNRRQLLKLPPDAIQAWVADCWQSNQQFDHDRDANWWLSVAEVTAGLATCRPENPSLDWARVAAEVYQQLMNAVSHPHNYALSLMLLRAEMIALFGSQPDDPLLNAQTIAAWFLDQLNRTPEQALAQSSAIRQALKDGEAGDVDIHTARELVELRCRVRLIQRLHRGGLLEDTPELTGWLAIDLDLLL